jgi:signal transduction histidine kinase
VLQAALYAALEIQIPDLATRWTTQSHKILLAGAPTRDGSDQSVQDSDVGHDLVSALLAVFAVGDEGSEAAITAGLRFGGEAYGRGASPHQTGKAVDLLVAMAMYAMEKAVAGSDMPRGSVADGIWLARRLQSRASLLSVAVIRGYTQAYGETLRDRFKHLRHDLRNPLGTIKSVLTLMDDESVPAEARANPNFRAIAKRNARALEDLIADRLGDTAVPLSANADQELSMLTLANTVRRELRSEAERRGITVLIEPSELQGRFDAPGLELLLRGTLQAALQEARTGGRIRIGFDADSESRAEIRLSHESGHAPIQKRNSLDRLTGLARKIGAAVTFSDQVVISVPIRVGDRGASVVTKHSAMREAPESSVAQTPHDLRSTREDDHGQANVL